MNKKVLIIILAAVVVVAGGAAAFFFFILPNMNKEPEEVRSAFSPGEYFVVNVKDSKSYVKTSIVLEVNRAADDEEFQTFLTANQHIIRDTIVFTLREKTLAELTSQDVKALLSPELILRLNSALGIDNVVGIYYNDYVVQ